MNPFEVLHEHVHVYIMQHLSANDAVKISEVSPSLNEIFESKLRLHLNVFCMSMEELKIISNSMRVYTKVSMNFNYNKRFNRTEESFKTPELLDYLKNLNQIEDFEVTFDYDDFLKFFVTDDAYNFIAGQKNLKSLKVIKDDFFVKAFALPTLFKLEHLSSLNIRSICPLVSSQRENLQSLRVVTVHEKIEISRFLGDFPKLKKLEIEFNFCPTHYDEEKIPINTVIKDLKLKIDKCCSAKPIPVEVVQEILTALPALEKLHINKLTIDAMEFIARNLQKLQKLSYDEADEGSLVRYEEMKLRNYKRINDGIDVKKNTN